MIYACLSLILISLIYVAGSHRIKTIIYVAGFQGIVLGILAINELDTSHPVAFGLTIAETFVVKGIGLPLFFLSILKKHKNVNTKHSLVPDSLNVILVSLVTVASVLLVNYVEPVRFSLDMATSNAAHAPKPLHLSVAIATILSGFILMLTRGRIFTMVLAFSIIENGIFLLTLSIGSEMSSLVHIGLLIDLLATVLMLGLLLNKMGFAYNDLHEDRLNKLHD